MIKLQTNISLLSSSIGIGFGDCITLLGSCFSDNIGSRMRAAGYDVHINPFGTLYNPESVANAVSLLDSDSFFTLDDCVGMGAGAGLVCSFQHHTSFARCTAEDFLENANESLKLARQDWKRSNKVIITLGTSWCFRHLERGVIVSNCLKRPASEYSRELISLDRSSALLKRMVDDHPDKQFIFTVSPIRHLSDGANANQISKSLLLLAENSVIEPGRAEYFPAYEIMMDELRDYRFYAEDMVHPSPLAVSYIWDRFCDFAVPDGDRQRITDNEKLYKRSQHINMH